MTRKVSKHFSPFLIHANWFQFGSGEKITRKRVESRMLLWVVRGCGSICVNGKYFQTLAGDWFFLPWAHSLEYHASETDPFLLGGIHLIPCLDRKKPVRFHVPHDSDDPLAGSPAQTDADLGDINELIQGRFSNEQDRLALLCSYLVQSFEATAVQVPRLSQCAQLLLEEIRLSYHQRRAQPAPVPSALFRAETYAFKHLHGKLRIFDLARSASCSTVTLHRLFRQFRKLSPGEWLARQRAERAAILLRTTTLKIHEIAPRVGIQDPFQFSRFFKRMKGSSPKAYRAAKGLF